MSSILRALKKIDQEALSRDNSSGDHEHEPDRSRDNIRRVVNRRAREKLPWFKRTHIIVFPVIFLLGAAAVVVFDWNSGPVPEKKAAPLTDKRPGTVLAQQKVVPQQQPQTTAQPALPVKKQPASPPLPQKNEKPIESTPNLKPAVKPATPKRTIPTKSIPTKTKPLKTNHPNFTLDGILWSQKPERRVAVINGNYYKVGERIDGVTIFEIKKNVVTLQSGEEKWVLHLKK